jgi:hypothetical protein
MWSRDPAHRRSALIRFFLCSIAVLMTVVYTDRISLPNTDKRIELHDSIIRGDAPSPYRYRLLVPFTAEALRRLGRITLPGRRAFNLAYAVTDLVSISTLLLALFAYFRHWFSDSVSLAGVLSACPPLFLAYHDHYYQPWSHLDACLLALGLHAIVRGRPVAIWGIAAIATVNRETGGFVAVAALAEGLMKWRAGGSLRAMRGGTVALLLATATYAGIRLARGDATPVRGLADLLRLNLASDALGHAAILVAVFYGVGWLFAIASYRTAPAQVRAFSWVLAPYLLLYLVFGVWIEIRVLMPTLPLVLPLVLGTMFGWGSGGAPSSGAGG